MKKLLLLALMSAFAMSGITNMNPFNKKIELNDIHNKRINVELCKTSIKYAHAYKDTMAKNEAAKTALDIYKKDVVENCGTISARVS
jgi:hypothetical protein